MEKTEPIIPEHIKLTCGIPFFTDSTVFQAAVSLPPYSLMGRTRHLHAEIFLDFEAF